MTSLGKRKFAIASVLAGFKKPRMSDMTKARRNRAPKGRAFIKGAISSSLRELKFVDIASASYVGDTTGTVTMLNGIAVGDDNTTRDGRQVSIESVQIRGKFVNFDTTSAATMCRLLVVWDNAANGVIATMAQILTAATSNSFPLIDNANRFTILSDQQYVVGPQDTTATQTLAPSPAIAPINLYKKIGAMTQYNGTGATIASIQNGALLMVTIGDTGAGGGGVFSLATRVRFKDD